MKVAKWRLALVVVSALSATAPRAFSATRLACHDRYVSGNTTEPNFFEGYGCAPAFNATGNEQVFEVILPVRAHIEVSLLLSTGLSLFLLDASNPDPGA